MPGGRCSNSEEPSSGKFIARTREFWQARTSRPLTGEDAREIIENVTGVFNILREWAAAESRGSQTNGDNP